MIIAHWDSSFFREFGGAEFHTAEVLNALARRGETCFLVACTPNTQEGLSFSPQLDREIGVHLGSFQNPLECRNNPFRFLIQLVSYMASACRFVAWLRKNRVDVIHQHFVGLDVVLLSVLKHVFRYRLVVTFHGMELELALDSKTSDWKNRLALNSADGVTSVSRELSGRLSRQYGVSDIQVIPVGVDVNKIRQLASLPSELTIEPGHFVYCGRIAPEKQVPQLVEAFAAAVRRGCGRNLYIMGGGVEERKVRSLVKRLGLGHRVFLLGTHTRSNALRMLKESRCVLLNSRSEGRPLVILETIALGRTLIAPDVGGICEMVTHEHNAVLFCKGDTEALVSAILSLDKDEGRLEKLVRNARATIATLPDLDTAVDSYLRLYRSRVA